MNLSLRIAFRYLFSKKSTNAINLISAITAMGMMVGSMVLIVFLSVFNGLEGLVISLYNSFNPELKIEILEGKTFKYDATLEQLIKQHSNISEVVLDLEESIYMRYDGRDHVGVVKGVSQNFLQLSQLDSFIVIGNAAGFYETGNTALIGSGVQAKLRTELESLFKNLVLYAPKKKSAGSLSGSNFRRKPVRVKAVFAIQQSFNQKYVIVPLETAQLLLNKKDQISALGLYLKDASQTNRLKQELHKQIGKNYSIKDRFEQNETLYKVMQLERLMVYAVLIFAMVIIAFNIIGSLSMLILEKRQDIAILRTLGASNRQIRNIFMLEGMMLSSLGGLIGVLLGLAICLVQIQFGLVKIPNSGSFIIDAYPVKLNMLDFVITIVVMIVISTIASIFPTVGATNANINLKTR